MSNWFDKLSLAAQKAYIKSHPNSKYAKGKKTSAAEKKSTRNSGVPKAKVSGVRTLKNGTKVGYATIDSHRRKLLTNSIKSLSDMVKKTKNEKIKKGYLKHINRVKKTLKTGKERVTL